MTQTFDSDQLDELIFEYLCSKRYVKTIETFAAESVHLSKQLSRKRVLDVEGRFFVKKADAKSFDDLRKKLSKKLCSFLIGSDSFAPIVSPVRKIEMALGELKSALNMNRTISSDEKQTSTIPFNDSHLGNSSFSYENLFTSPVRQKVNGESQTIGSKIEAKMQEPDTPPKSDNSSKVLSGHLRKTPNPKSLDSQMESSNNALFTVGIFEPDKWNQVVEEHVNHSAVPDAVADAINVCYSDTNGANFADVNRALENIESNEDLVKELQAMLEDYCAAEASSSSSYGFPQLNSMSSAYSNFPVDSYPDIDLNFDEEALASSCFVAKSPAKQMQSIYQPHIKQECNPKFASSSSSKPNTRLVRSSLNAPAVVKKEIVVKELFPNYVIASPCSTDDEVKFAKPVTAAVKAPIKSKPSIIKSNGSGKLTLVLPPQPTPQAVDRSSVNNKSSNVGCNYGQLHNQRRITVSNEKIEEVLQQLHGKKK